jgi:hypothetical protein
MIGQPGLHGWRDAERLVNPTLIVIGEIQKIFIG